MDKHTVSPDFRFLEYLGKKGISVFYSRILKGTDKQPNTLINLHILKKIMKDDRIKICGITLSYVTMNNISIFHYAKMLLCVKL